METQVDQKKIQEMLQCGLQYGHPKSRSHPKANPFIISTKNNVEIINLEITYFKLQEAIEKMRKVINSKGLILFVPSFPTNIPLIQNLAKLLNQPYISEKWIGGLLTNFKTITERIKYYEELKQKSLKKELDKYTKKEKMKLELQLQDLENKFEGLVNLSRKPDLLFIVDPQYNKTAVNEAIQSKIPIIAILDNDDDPTPIHYPIPANDSSISSVKWIVEEIKNNLLPSQNKENNEQQTTTLTN